MDAPNDSIGSSPPADAGLPGTATLLESLPVPVALLDAGHRIIVANGPFRNLGMGHKPFPFAEIRGLRPGEAMGCVNSGGGACGTTDSCRSCGAWMRLLQAASTGRTARGDLQLEHLDTHGRVVPMDLAVTVVPVAGSDGARIFVLSLEDRSAEKHRRVLERLFYHDIINAAGGIKGLADLGVTTPDVPPEMQEYMENIRSVAGNLLDGIHLQRELAAAEAGELKPDIQSVHLHEVVTEAVRSLIWHEVARNRILLQLPIPPDLAVLADRGLLRRVLVNMIKNALEACPSGGTVRVESDNGDPGFPGVRVTNPGVLPDAVAARLFRRSFSTKGTGRGLGTWSMKLFTEHYLGGRLMFRSSPEEGTVFIACFPAPAAS